MKKSFIIIFITITLLIIPSVNINAKTITDYRNDINKIKSEKEAAANKTAETQAKIDAAKAEINRISNKIILVQQESTITNQKIKQLELNIEEKEYQIKDLVVFKQKSGNENFYLKYIFGSEDFTDLIYRVSVIQQLVKKSDSLVNEMNQLIKDNDSKIDELKTQEKQLSNLNNEIFKQIDNLGDEKSKYAEEEISYDEEIANIEKQIKYFKNLGCTETQDLSACTSNIPSDSGFIRPLTHAVITSDFGWRCDPYCGTHRGIDLANSSGTQILAAAAGKVVYVDWYGNCGYTVILNHVINGKNYSTVYYHMKEKSTYVKVGDIVSQGQTIGRVGSTGYSTGPHLHFQVQTGHYYGTGRDSYTYGVDSHLVNPRNVVNFPSYGVWW